MGERKRPHSYPDMKLYQEIIFLTHFFKGKFLIENVTPYYEPLIKPQKLGRHCFWSNFKIEIINVKSTLNIKNGLKRDIGLDISKIKFDHRKDQIMSNCVEPETGLHILKCSFLDKEIMSDYDYAMVDKEREAKAVGEMFALSVNSEQEVKHG